jgi:hypothetical protein
MGIITDDDAPQQALKQLKKLPNYGTVDFVKQVTTDVPYQWGSQNQLKKPHKLYVK